MKQIAKTISIIIFLKLTVLAQPTYLMNLSSPQIVDDKTIEFDVNIESTGQDFILTSYQCAFSIDEQFLNDTSFCFEYIPATSELSNAPLYGVGCTKVDGTRKIHFASNAGVDSITTHPTRVGRFMIKKSSTLLIDSLHITWLFDGIYKTILTGDNFQEITNPTNHESLIFRNERTSYDNFLVCNSDEGVLDGDVHLKEMEGSNSSQVVYFLNTYSTLTFTMNLNKSEEWYAWGRMFFDSNGGSRNELYVQVDTSLKIILGGDNNSYDRWHWEGNKLSKLSLGKLTSGIHKIKIYSKAGNVGPTVMLDQILLTTDSNLVASDDLLQLNTPVELISFTGLLNKRNQVELNWITATEMNNYGFYIEKSTDKKNWNNVGFVKGNGTSSKKHYYHFIDKNTLSENYYRIKQVDVNGSYDYSNFVEVNAVPKFFSLQQNYPNPFNPSTNIQYSINQTCNVKLDIYNLLGEKVAELKNEIQSSGAYNLNWNASNYSSGTYILAFYAKPTNGSSTFKEVRKMLLLK